MKALVVTDTWKAALGRGDYVTEDDYPEEVIRFAAERQYVVIVDDKPTMDDLKKDIQAYCDTHEVPYESSDTKQDLIDKIHVA